MIGGPESHIQAGVPPVNTPRSVASSDSIGQLIRDSIPQSGAAKYLNEREQKFQVDTSTAAGDTPSMAQAREQATSDSVRGQHPDTSPGVRNKNEPRKDWYQDLINRRTI